MSNYTKSHYYYSISMTKRNVHFLPLSAAADPGFSSACRRVCLGFLCKNPCAAAGPYTGMFFAFYIME